MLGQAAHAWSSGRAFSSRRIAVAPLLSTTAAMRASGPPGPALPPRPLMGYNRATRVVLALRAKRGDGSQGSGEPAPESTGRQAGGHAGGGGTDASSSEKQQASANASNAELLAELRLGFSEVRLGFSKFEGQLKSLEETVTGVKGQLNTLEERVTGLRKDFNGWVGSVGDEMNIMSRSIRSLEGSRRGVAWGTEQASVQAAAEMLAAREEQRLGGGLGQDGVVVRGVVVGGQVFFCEVKGGGEKRREVDGAGVLVVFEGEGGKCKVQLKPFVVECKTGSVSWPVAGKFVNLVSGQAVSKSKKGSARAQLFSSRGGWGALLQEGRTGRGGPVFAFLLDCVMAEVAALAAQWDATPPTKGEVEAALAAGARAGVTAVLAAPNMDDAVRSAVHAEGVVTLCWAAPWDLQPA